MLNFIASIQPLRKLLHMLRDTVGYRGRWGKVMFISVVSTRCLGLRDSYALWIWVSMDIRAGLDTVVTKRNTCNAAENGTSDLPVHSHSTDSAIAVKSYVCVFEICVWRLKSCIFVCFFLSYDHLSLFLSLQTLHKLPVMQPINLTHTGNWNPHLRDECQGTVKLALGDVFSHPSVGPFPGDSRRKFSSFFIPPLSITLRLYTRDYLLPTWHHSHQN